jgi:hypothetical protein
LTSDESAEADVGVSVDDHRNGGAAGERDGGHRDADAGDAGAVERRTS